jgi:hypothetical protein
MTLNMNLKKYLWVAIAISVACAVFVFASRKPTQQVERVDYQIIQQMTLTPPDAPPKLLVTITREVSADGRYHQVNIMPGKGVEAKRIESYFDGQTMFMNTGRGIIRENMKVTTDVSQFDPTRLSQMNGFVRTATVLEHPVWVYRNTDNAGGYFETWMNPKFGMNPLRLERVSKAGKEILQTISLTIGQNDPSIFEVPQEWIATAKEQNRGQK